MKRIFSFVLLFSLVDCMSVGREVKSDQLTGFEKGKTTISDVTTQLGRPNSVTTLSDGRKVMMYSFVHAQARPETFIPLIGGFIGGSDMRSSGVVFTFDKAGLMDNYTQTESSTGMSTGLTGGTYTTPDRTLPQERP